jgi:hypothetical protein
MHRWWHDAVTTTPGELVGDAHGDDSGTPLRRKLGIREGSTVRLIRAPPGFEGMLVPLPTGARLLPRVVRGIDVVVLFTTREAELRRRFGTLAASLDPAGRLWVGWPKKASGVVTDLDFGTVQQIGLQAGLVDNKSASLTADHQGVQFVYRLADRPARSGAARSPTRTRPGSSTSP